MVEGCISVPMKYAGNFKRYKAMTDYTIRAEGHKLAVWYVLETFR